MVEDGETRKLADRGEDEASLRREFHCALLLLGCVMASAEVGSMI